MSAGPVRPVTAAGKQGASAATVLPSVRFATLSRSLMAPEVVSLAVKLPTALTAVSRPMPVAATAPRLPPVTTPVANWVTEPVVEVKRTVLAAPAVSAWLTTRLPVLQRVTSAGPVIPVTAAGKQGASAVIVFPSVSVATLSRNLTAPDRSEERREGKEGLSQ